MHGACSTHSQGPCVLGAFVGLVYWPSPSYLDAGSKLLWLTASQLRAGVRAGLWQTELVCGGASLALTRSADAAARCLRGVHVRVDSCGAWCGGVIADASPAVSPARQASLTGIVRS